MTKKKIKVLDITPENNENTPINDDVEVVKETEQIEEKQEEVIEKQPETITPEGQQTQEEVVEEQTEIVEKTREQQLRQCPKCLKWLTPKTLRYFHQCTKNDTVKAKRRPHKKVIEVKKNDDERPTFSEDIEDIEPPPMPVKLMRQTNQIVEQGEKFLKSINTDKIDYKPPVEVSYEDMRRERIKQRIQQRSIKMTSLFANAI